MHTSCCFVSENLSNRRVPFEGKMRDAERPEIRFCRRSLIRVFRRGARIGIGGAAERKRPLIQKLFLFFNLVSVVKNPSLHQKYVRHVQNRIHYVIHGNTNRIAQSFGTSCVHERLYVLHVYLYIYIYIYVYIYIYIYMYMNVDSRRWSRSIYADVCAHARLRVRVCVCTNDIDVRLCNCAES